MQRLTQGGGERPGMTYAEREKLRLITTQRRYGETKVQEVRARTHTRVPFAAARLATPGGGVLSHPLRAGSLSTTGTASRRSRKPSRRWPTCATA